MSNHPLKTILDTFQKSITRVDFQDKADIEKCQKFLYLSKISVKENLQEHLPEDIDKLALKYFLTAEEILQEKTSSKMQDLSDIYEQIIHSL